LSRERNLVAIDDMTGLLSWGTCRFTRDPTGTLDVAIDNSPSAS
jgi:hypothetical protein